MSAPAIAQSPTPPTTSTPAATSTTPPSAPDTPTGKALAQAKKDNRRVEIEALRSEKATYYADPDGKTVRMEQHLQPIRVKNAKGDGFTPIDTTLVETDGVIKPKAVKGELTLSAGDDAFVLKSKGGKGSATIGSPGELPKPTLKGSTATYPSLYGKGIDLVVTATATGFKQEIVLRERVTGPVSFRIPTTVPKNLALEEDAAGKPALLSQGKKIADLPPALLLDAVAADLDGDADAGKVGKAAVTLDQSASALVYTPDPAYLADPAVAYPVTLAAFDDDWWEPELGNDTFVNNADYPNGYANSGLDRILVGKSNDGAVRWRSYIRFDEFPDDHPIRGATIQNADLVLWNHLSSDCGEFVGSGITAYQVTERWDVTTLTWSSQPRITTTGADTEYAGYAGENCSGAMNYPWDLIHSVDDIVQAWADGEPNYGFQLTAGNESDLRNWRRYRTNEAGGCTMAPRQDCLGTLHPPFLTVDFEPKIKEEVRGYYVPGPSDGTTPTTEEITEHLTDQADAPELPALNEEQARALRQNAQDAVVSDATDGFYEVEGVSREEWLESVDPDEEGFEPKPDGTPPEVAITDPVAGATQIPVSAVVHVTFDEQIANAAFVVKDANGSAVNGETSVQGTRASFVPGQPLKAATTYTAQITATDVDGTAMTAPYSWSFSTGSADEPPQGLVAAYGMNEGSGTNVADSSGQNNTGTTSVTSWATGKYGQALSFNGTSSWVTVEDAESLRLTTGMTLSAWVNPATLSGVFWRSVLTKELNDEGASYTLYAADGGGVPSGWVQTGPEDPEVANGVSPLQVNTWSHLAFTYDGTALRLFVNGQQADQVPLSGSLYDDGGPLRIGGNAVWGEYFSGLIDEVRIYSRAQSAAEIQTDMNTPIGQTTEPDAQAPTAPGSLTATGGSGGVQLTWTASTDNIGVTGYRIHRSATPGFTPSAANQVGTGTATMFTDGGLAAGTYYYQVRAIDAAGNLSPSSAEVSATVTAAPTSPGLVAAYGMNEGSGTTIGDSSGKNNTGAATDTTWADGKHGKALSFNGTSSWVTVPHAASLRLTNALTLSAWVRPATVDGWRTLLMKENADGPSYGLYASCDPVPLGWLENASTAVSVVGDDPLPLNTWSHLALTYNGSIITLYLNGAVIDQTPMTGNLADDGGPLRIGGNDLWSNEFFSGLIDEVRIYNRVQTAAEIQADMNTPIGAAVAGSTERKASTGADSKPAAGIEKLTVNDSYSVDGATVISTLTPRLTTWLAAGRDGNAKVYVEIARPLTKISQAAGANGLARVDKADAAERLIWSGSAAATDGDSKVTVQVPKGKLQDGELVRWRTRLTNSDAAGGWTPWQDLKVKQEPAQPWAGRKPAATRTSAPTAASAELTSSPTSGQTVQAAGSPFNYQRIDKQGDCQLSRNESHATWRWVKNSFNVCFTGRIGETYTVNNVATGVAWSARFSIVVHTFVGSAHNAPNPETASGDASINSRQMKVWIKVDQFYPNGFPGAASRPVNISVGHTSSTCIADRGRIEDNIGEWIRGADRLVILTSPKTAFPGTDRLGFCGIKPQVYYPETDDPDKRLGYLSPDRVEFRCDSSPRIRPYTGGCVVYSSRPVWHLDGNRAKTPDPETGKMTGVDQTAAHIWKALYDPDDTVPLAPGRKNIPGRYSKNDPGCMSASNRCLTRAEGDRKDPDTVPGKNEVARKKVCRLAPVPSGLHLPSCDEYPFASTHQGAAFAGYDFSVAKVECRDNTTAGALLKSWYDRHRILEKDPFWVDATKEGDTPPQHVPPPDIAQVDTSGLGASCVRN